MYTKMFHFDLRNKEAQKRRIDPERDRDDPHELAQCQAPYRASTAQLELEPSWANVWRIATVAAGGALQFFVYIGATDDHDWIR